MFKAIVFCLLFTCSVTAFISEGPETKAVSLSPSVHPTAVFVQGWMANATPSFFVGDRALDVYACLQQCRDSWSPRCRMVSYNMETGICTKFTKTVATGGENSPRSSRNIFSIVAANSEKCFTTVPDTYYHGDDVIEFDTGSPEQCKRFCHSYPICNAAFFHSTCSQTQDHTEQIVNSLG